MRNSRLILASASPRRLELLRLVGIVPSQTIPAEIDETQRRAELPRALAGRLAQEKAQAVAVSHPDDFVLAADTVVACGRRVLGKAESEKDVRAFLGLLSGRRHAVIGGIALIVPRGRLQCRVVETVVQFRKLTNADIEAMATSGEGVGKAGGYAIQGGASAYIKFIRGSYSNVVGLSVYDTMQMLNGAGFINDKI